MEPPQIRTPIILLLLRRRNKVGHKSTCGRCRYVCLLPTSVLYFSSEVKSLIVRHNYQANPESPGGFKELSILKGLLVSFVYVLTAEDRLISMMHS